MLFKKLYYLAGLCLLTPLSAFAQEADSISGSDTGWLLASTALVLLMTPALAFFYGGLVRSKNALNTMMMSFVALGISGTLWAIAGYSFAFGSGNAFFGDFSAAFLMGVGLDPNGTIPDLLFVGFQGTFAIITAALISGAVVERIRFIPYILFIGLWGLFVYAPICHWVWGGGWLGNLGALDFAGGAVVHVNAGVAAIVAARVLGPRKDYGREALLPHNVPFVLLGAGLLWFGWFGFNGGSALAADGIAALALVNTLLAPSAGVFVWAILDHFTTKKITAVGIATGIVVGLVAITPAAGFVSPGGALILGAVGVIPSYFIIKWRTRTSLDDSLDVFAAHGMGGIMGALLTGVLATTAINPGGADGLLFSGTFGQLGIQALSVAAVAVFSGVVTYMILKIVGFITTLRAESSEEGMGMDLVAHGEEAYATGEGAVLLNEKEVPASVNGLNHS